MTIINKFGFLIVLIMLSDAEPSLATSCLIHLSKESIVGEFEITKKDVPVRICDRDEENSDLDPSIEIKQSGCILHLKLLKETRRRPESMTIPDGVFVLGEVGKLCKRKVGEKVTLRVSPIGGTCCGVMALNQFNDFQCKLKPKPHFIKKQSDDFNKCNWEGVKWEVSKHPELPSLPVTSPETKPAEVGN